MAQPLDTNKKAETLILCFLPKRLSLDVVLSGPPQVFQTFACEHLDEVNKSYLRADLRIECNTPEHKVYQIYAWIMICICELLSLGRVFICIAPKYQNHDLPPFSPCYSAF